jgi:hypothetical protein
VTTTSGDVRRDSRPAGARGRLDTWGAWSRANPGKTVGWALFVAVIAYVLSVSQMSHHNERLNNPARPDPLPAMTWHGLDVLGFWIPLFYIVNAVIMVAFGIFYWRHWRRTGTYHVSLPVFIGTWLVSHIWEPIGDWATFCSYHPEQPHLPEDWPLINLAPTVLPLWILEGSYPVFFLMPALLAFGAYGRFVRWRMARNANWSRSWAAKHPCWMLAWFVLVVGLGADILMESWMMNIGVYKYTELPPGWVLQWGRSHLHWAEIFFMAAVMAAKGVLLYRDDRGRNNFEDGVARVCGLGRMGNGLVKQTIIGAIATAFVLVVYGGFFGYFRLTDNLRTVAGDYPFRTVKTYDPFGHLERAGNSGPFQTWYPWTPAAQQVPGR